jgi:hypothetical protein
MGILEMNGSQRRHFSSMVLKIELEGPGRSHFAILDLPGVFSTTTDDITPEEMRGVDDMVAKYLDRPENIIM